MELKGGSIFHGGAGPRKPQRPINTMSVYDYSLRCAIRACLEQTSNLRPTLLTANRSERDRRSVHLGVSDMLGSLTDRFGDESKPDKLTREVVRALLRRLDDIKKGKDTSKMEYHEQRFLTVAAQVQKSVQQHRYRPSGTINDLVIMFLKTSETEFKKENPNMAAWRDDLTRYVARFAEILKQTVQEDCPSSCSPELIDKLNGFIGSGRPSSKPRQLSEKRNQSGPGSPLPSLAYGSIESLENFPMVKTVQALFQVDPLDHRRKLRELQPMCTQSAFMHDLKRCINNVHTNQPYPAYPARPEDFLNRQAYDTWQKREVKQLSELLKTLTLLDPNLSMGAGDHDVNNNNSNSSNGNRSPYNQDQSSPTTGFTFIPGDPRSYFRLLMNMCIDYDTDIIPDSERAKTSVLSQQSDDLLRECWRTWRLSAPFRTLLYMELIKQRFDQGIFNIDDIRDVLRTLDKALKENDVNSWTLADRANLVYIYEGMERTFILELANGLSEYWKISPDWIRDLVSLLDRIYQDPLYLQSHPNPLSQYQSLVETVEGAAVERWRSLEKACIKGDDDDLTNLLTLADRLTKELVSLVTKKFKSPIKGVLSVPGVVMTIQMPYFALEMENWAYLPSAQDAPIEVTFNLYHKVLSLKRLYDQYGPQQKAALFKVESWFLSHVRRWLKTTDAATPEWVENAIKQDEFKPTNNVTMHSSSIVDLFSLFHQAVDFVQKLQWPNEYQRCRFMTALSKVIGVALTQYTYAIEDMITEDIYPHTLHDRNAPGSHSFLDKAKLQLTGSRSSIRPDSIPDDFTLELCVKINDIEAARSRLDRLYQIMDVDDIAEYLREHGVTTIDKEDQVNFLYSIKAVRAENLQAKDSNGLSDPYVIFEIDGKQVCRTRTVYETLNPRWDQTFDLWLGNETVSVLGIVYDEDLLTAHDECGAAWFKLSPEYFDDYQSHEMVLDLHPQGKLILRITMEGEKDDIQFWFGKAFRTLKRAENDAAGLIVDRMGRYIRHCLSRKVLDKLLCRDRSFFSSFSRNHKQVEPSLQDCEDAIIPLLDYLERNLNILNDNLSESNMQLVILKIWKEILIALEGVLLPPLSEHHSDMKPLDDYEFHVVYKWLELLKILFNGGEDGDAVPLEKLENSHYYALLAINVAYNLETEQLMDSYHAAVSNQAEFKQRGGRKADRSKSVYHSKNTVRKRKPKKVPMSVAQTAAAAIDLPSGEVILRILRMRSGKHVREFLRTEFDKRNNAPPPVPAHSYNNLKGRSLDSLPLLPQPSSSSTTTSSPALPPPPPVPVHYVNM